MPTLPIQCPRCNGVSQIDSAWAEQQVACPICGGTMIAPAAPTTAAPLARSDAFDLLPPAPDRANSAAMPQPTPPANPLAPTAPATPNVATRPTPSPAANVLPGVTNQQAIPSAVRRLAPEERAQRRLRKNIILFIACLVLLIVVFYLLAMRSL